MSALFFYLLMLCAKIKSGSTDFSALMMANPGNAAPQRSAKQARFHQLDAIRGIAALAVVLSHYTSFMASDPLASFPDLNAAIGYLMMSPFGGLLVGLPAVLVFFVLSGFALTKMLQSTQDTYWAYAVKRVTRIWPPYVVSIALCAIFIATMGWPEGAHVGGWVAGITGHPLVAGDVVDHLLLLGAFDPHYNFVAWTLVYEMRISLLFPLIYLTLIRWNVRRVLITYGALSFVCVALLYLAKWKGQLLWANWFATGHYVLFFSIGGLIALNVDAIRSWYVSRSSASKALLFFILIISYTYPAHIRNLGGYFKEFPMVLTHWMILPGVTLLVITSIASQKVGMVLMHPSLQWLGKVSYSLYLFHPLVLFLMLGLLSESFSVLPASLLGIGLSLLVAMVAYQWVELPSQKMGRVLAGRLKRIPA